MIAAIQATYPSKRDSPCISIHTDTTFHVYDPPLPEAAEDHEVIRRREPCARRVGEPVITDLTVHNPREHAVHLVAIDSCMYDSGDITRCDCALIREPEIHFVEFKHGVKTRRSERVKECIPQLAATINDFIKAGIIAPGSEVLAIACVGFQEELPPRSAQLEIRTVQLNNLVEAGVAVRLLVTDTTTFA